MIYLLALLALVAGALIPVQAAANAALSKSLTGGVVASALTLFAVAVTVALAAVAITRTPLPSWNEFRAAPVWSSKQVAIQSSAHAASASSSMKASGQRPVAPALEKHSRASLSTPIHATSPMQ